MLPARFWELGAGCLTFFAFDRLRRPLPGSKRMLIWATSMIMMFATLAWPVDDLRLSTVLIVLATALAIINYEPGSKIAAWFAGPSLVFIGSISYSLYLWHWPVIVLFRHSYGVNLSNIALIVGLVFSLSCCSYFLVERPLRLMKWSKLPLRTLGIAGGGIAAVAIFVMLLNQSGWKHVIGDRAYVETGPHFTISGLDCHMPQFEVPVSQCLTPGKDKTIFILGDSHAHSLIPGIDQSANEYEIRYLTDRALKFHLLELDACGGTKCSKDEVGARIDFLSQHANSGDVVVFSISRDTFYGSSIFNGAARQPQLGFDRKLKKNLGRLISAVHASGARFILIEDLPKTCNDADYARNSFNNGLCKVPSHVSLDDREPISAVYRELAESYPVLVVDPHPLLCSEETCSNYIDNELIYSDGSPHLTLKASLSLAPLYFKEGVFD
jgi:hypothetical protein